MKLVVPGIPFPVGDDKQGDQLEDAGVHKTLYVRPANATQGVPYTPPDLTACRALAGKPYTFGMEENIKILCGDERNDMKTGSPYYLSVFCDKAAVEQAVSLQRRVGLTPDTTQKFHISLAGIAPAWMVVHPKSKQARQKPITTHIEDFRIFRHGDDASGFEGFNCDSVTNWTSHFVKSAQCAEENKAIVEQIEALDLDSPDHMQELNELKEKKKQKTDEMKALGFCKPVGRAAGIKRIMQPSTESQQRIMRVRRAY